MNKGGNEKIKVWCLFRDQFSHIKPVEEYLGQKAEFIYDSKWDPVLLVSSKPDLVVCVNEHPYEIALCLDAARQASIPSLVLQDGILEWRCLYENPAFGAGGGPPWHQPVLADKIACIGYQSARQIASWGNARKVEVTGMPRLDVLLEQAAPPPRRPGQRILVMTAKKPWFTPGQKDVILRSLADLKEYFGKNPHLEVVWRVTKGLSETIGVQNTLHELSMADLSTVLSQVDAVITTISTAILEAMLFERPVAIIDYFNVPHFIPSSWTISSPEHIPAVITELLNPPLSKTLFQQDCLRYCLRLDVQAASHVAELMFKMVGWAKNHAEAPLQFPSNLLNYQDSFPQVDQLHLSEMYPEPELFKEDQVLALQVRLARLIKENEKLQSRKLGYWIELGGNFLAKKMHYKRTSL